MKASIKRQAAAHYGSVRAELLALEARVGKRACAPLHAALGRAWDGFREAFPDGSFTTLSGGTDKTPDEPPPPPPDGEP